MKPNSQIMLLIFFLYVFLLVFSCSASARLLPPKQAGAQKVNVNAVGFTHIAQAGSFVEIKQEDFSDLMGLEKCEDHKDEECLKRRMVAEAHLDYIYTQHHNP